MDEQIPEQVVPPVSQPQPFTFSKLLIILIVVGIMFIGVYLGSIVGRSRNQSNISNTSIPTISPKRIPTQAPLPTSTFAGSKWYDIIRKYCPGSGADPKFTVGDLHIITANPNSSAGCDYLNDDISFDINNETVSMQYQSKDQIEYQKKLEMKFHPTYSLVKTDQSKDIKIYSSLGDVDCGEPAPCYIGKGISVNLAGVKTIQLPNDDEFVFSISLKKIISPQDKRLIDLFHNQARNAIESGTDQTGQLIEEINMDKFDYSLLTKTFNTDFNSPNQNGKSPIQTIENTLQSLDIDKSFYFQQ